VLDGAAAGYAALRTTVAAVPIAREVVRVHGPDAASYLQGQLSQDVVALEAGGSAWAWLLQPAGKVDALVRVIRVGQDDFLVDTDAGWSQAVVERLNRFKLRTDAVIERLPWRVLGLRGPEARSLALGSLRNGDVVADASWPGLPGLDLLGPDPAPPAGVANAEPADYEAARVEAGVPVMGAELTERTIPAETGLVELTVSFTKGCYTGQELVARIDSRGSHVARHLRGLRLSGAAPAGSSLEAAGKTAGTLTSVAHSPASGWVGLGYVNRNIDVPAVVEVSGEGVSAEVALLPLVP
jgi:folate-binding protein YgfZ